MHERFMRVAEVSRVTGLARSTIYLRMSQGRFPTAVPIGSAAVVGWLESEIDAYLAEQISAARPKTGTAA